MSRILLTWRSHAICIRFLPHHSLNTRGTSHPFPRKQTNMSSKTTGELFFYSQSLDSILSRVPIMMARFLGNFLGKKPDELLYHFGWPLSKVYLFLLWSNFPKYNFKFLLSCVITHQTRIFVTHGINFLPQVDHIIVLQDGFVSEVCKISIRLYKLS